MAHFAQLDNNNTVIDIIVLNNEDCLDENGIESERVGIAFCKQLLGGETKWVQTSYNANFRKRYASIGCTFDAERDAFIAPQPFPSWVLNEDTCSWDSPTAMPEDGRTYMWDESTLSWVLDNKQTFV